MKLPILLFSAALISIPLAGQSPNPNPKAPKPANKGEAGLAPLPDGAGNVSPTDPFAKGGGAGAGSALANPSARPTNLLTIVETWKLSSADFLILLDESANSNISHDRVRELAAQNKASLQNVMAIATRSGQRAVIEAIDEVRIPSEYQQPIAEGEIAFPKSVQTWEVGDSFELETVLSEDGKLGDLSTVIQSRRLASIRPARSEPEAMPVPVGDLTIEKITTSMNLPIKHPRFIGNLTRITGREVAPVAEATLAFVRMDSDTLTTDRAIPAVPGGNIRIDLMLFKIGRSSAQAILRETGDSAKIYAATRELVAKGTGELEMHGSIIMRSGQRSVMECQTPVQFSTAHFIPERVSKSGGEGPARTIRLPASPSEFETRTVGLTLEVESVIDQDGQTVELSIAPRAIGYRGGLKMPPEFMRYPEQPLFEARNLTTAINVLNGAPGFLGTMNHPRDNGVNDRADDGKTVMAFVRATIAEP